ncbi:adenine phosphoribosyltransferase [Allobaculum mucilyticum]|uniref:adenine phosphoribosyltransferase n=1 Tax=Allobaculum mucilyticum TaxID=2834459 RepID=UPI001E2E78E9|nr:adenine phosphoribosyltransferase [Allobaculum mucilyticum]UNT95780.1 adenine phosphoribosyltransferase [Allobaculum mucilyticum]
MDLKESIASIPGFPKEGIIFRDITPILADPEALEYTGKEIAKFAKEVGADVIVAPEARGFMFGIPAALEARLPFVPVRKPGKLPRKTIEETYTLEYGTDRLQMHADDLKKGSRVLIVDDLLATGGTVEAIARMVERQGAVVAGFAFVVELDDLLGRKKLGDRPVLSLVHYEGE